MSRNLIFHILLVLAVLSSGCVSSGKYKALLSDRDSLKNSNRKLEMEVDSLTSKNETMAARLDEIEQEKNRALQAKEAQKSTMDEMIKELQGEIEDKTVKISMMEDSLKLELLDKLLFASGSTNLTERGENVLGRIAPILKQAGTREIRVIGHTDEVPPGPSLKDKFPSNWELSGARAAAVISVLQWGYGIEPERMVAEGVAHYRPLAPGTDEEARKANRAVEIILAPER